jgi:CRISPR type III-A-associated RAMP protein Csm5
VRGEIHRTINSNGRAYIPGSTIKGLFRTALAFNFLRNDFELLKHAVNYAIRRNVSPKKAFNWLNEKIFLDPHRDPLKNLLVSDTKFYSPSDIGVFATTRMYLKTFQQGPPVSVEAVVRDKETTFSLKIMPFKIFKSEFMFLEDEINAWKNLFKQVNAFTKALLEREIRELSTHHSFTSICSQYETFLNQLDKLENACIGRIGFGKTVFDETVILLLEQCNETELLKKFEAYLNRNFWKRRRRSLQRRDPLPSTRLIVLDKRNNPQEVLGWVKMRLVS